MATFTPYWLIHEPDKDHGFAIVARDEAQNPEQAVDAWRATANPDTLKMFDLYQTQVAARLITEPLYPES